MRDITIDIRDAYYNLLNNVVVEGETIPVFDSIAPYPEKVPYIIIDGILCMSNNTRDDFGNNATVDLLVYTSYMGDFGGRKKAGKIANRVLELAIPQPGMPGISIPDLNVTVARYVGKQDEHFEHQTKRTFRQRITIEHTVWES